MMSKSTLKDFWFKNVISNVYYIKFFKAHDFEITNVYSKGNSSNPVYSLISRHVKIKKSLIGIFSNMCLFTSEINKLKFPFFGK